MARKPKDYDTFSCRLEKDKSNKLTEINEETGVPKTIIIERAIELYYRTYKETGKL